MIALWRRYWLVTLIAVLLSFVRWDVCDERGSFVHTRSNERTDLVNRYQIPPKTDEEWSGAVFWVTPTP